MPLTLDINLCALKDMCFQNVNLPRRAGAKIWSSRIEEYGKAPPLVYTVVPLGNPVNSGRPVEVETTLSAMVCLWVKPGVRHFPIIGLRKFQHPNPVAEFAGPGRWSQGYGPLTSYASILSRLPSG
jgi:hypothetical protein